MGMIKTPAAAKKGRISLLRRRETNYAAKWEAKRAHIKRTETFHQKRASLSRKAGNGNSLKKVRLQPAGERFNQGIQSLLHERRKLIQWTGASKETVTTSTQRSRPRHGKGERVRAKGHDSMAGKRIPVFVLVWVVL